MKSSKPIFLLLFLLILILESTLYLYLVLNRRMVLGHDGLELFAQQWFFLNAKVSHSQVPLWTPYMTHGNPLWWFFSYSRVDIFTNVMMLFSNWIKGINFLPIFYAGMFFNKFILLVGVWLLGKRYFKSPVTVFFVASTILSSTITLTQSSFSLTLFYAIPLIIYLLHRFFDSWSWKWLFLALFFYCTISINTYNFLPIISLAVFLYFLVYYLDSLPALIKSFKIGRRDLLWVFLIIILVEIFVLIFKLANDPLMNINTAGRQLDGGVSLTSFLSYGGNISLIKWLEPCLGISPKLDYTLYMGVLSIPLIFLGAFFSKNSNRSPFLIGAIFFLLFSNATIISSFVYQWWPLMKYYRHIGLIAPLIKLYLCFLAGFGFEQLFDPQLCDNRREVFYKSIFCALILFVVLGLLSYMIIKPHQFLYLLNVISVRASSIPISFSPVFYTHALKYMFLLCLAGVFTFLLRPVIRTKGAGFLCLSVLIFFHVMDVYGYAFEQEQLRTFSLTPKQYALMEFKKIPYLTYRSLKNDTANPRECLTSSLIGARLDSFNNFTYSDYLRPLQRSDYSLSTIHQLLGVFNANEHSIVLNKITGVSEDKIQFFTQAHMATSADIVKAMKNKKYAGDIFFVQRPGMAVLLTNKNLDGVDVGANQRLSIPYQVLSFGPNEIIIKVDTSVQKGIWLEYCDLWHPFWKAAINGQAQDLYIGNLAYKALPLKVGINTVHIFLESNVVKFLYYFMMYSSLIWMIGLICLLMF